MEGVGATSLLTAAARALETEKPDGLLSDPFARSLAGDEGFALLERVRVGPVAENGTPLYVVRHRFLDDWLLRVTASPEPRQVVLLAAGLDTRALRLDWPSDTHLFEIDQPDVFAHKDTVLQAAGATPRCDRHVVSADLREDWTAPLVGSGFEPSRPSAWIAEGLLFYLPEAAVHRLLDEAHRLAAPGSHLATDVLSVPGPPQEFRDTFASLGAPFLFTTDDPGGLLRAHGWDNEVVSLDEAAQRLGAGHLDGGLIVLAHR